MRRALLWLALGVVVLFAVLASMTDTGAAVVAKVSEAVMGPDSEATTIRRAARAAAVGYGVDPDLVEAIGWVESRWRMSAVNNTGPDGARGGSWGPFQLSQLTAKGYGYTGPMEAFTEDPDLAAAWCARILAARPGGPPKTPEEAAAWWNAGRPSTANLPASTRDGYIPSMTRALAVAAATPLPDAGTA